MEIGLREWLIIGGAVLVLLIVIDGWRRTRGARNQLRMDIEKQPAEAVEEVVDDYNPELPNGGARRITSETEADPPAAQSANKSAVVTSPAADVASSVDSAAVAVSSEVAAGVESKVHLSPESISNPDATVINSPVTETADRNHETESTDQSFSIPVAAERQRVEPTFNLDSLTVPPERRVESISQTNEVAPAIASGIDIERQNSDTPRATEEASAKVDSASGHLEELAVEEARETVVEEEILTSAALFEAIEQSRKVRLADFDTLDEADEPHAVTAGEPVVAESELQVAKLAEAPEAEAGAFSPVIEEVEAQVTPPAVKPDPLLRPPDIQTELMTVADVADNYHTAPIVVADKRVLDDPLMAGVEEESLEERSEQTVIDELSEQMKPQAFVGTTEPRGVDAPAGTFEPVADQAEEPEPLFISEIAADSGNTPRSSEPASPEPAFAAELEESVLELPDEFVPVKRESAEVVSIADSGSKRSSTVVAFPDKERGEEVEHAVVESVEPLSEMVDSSVEEFEADSSDSDSDSDSDVKVKGGSLRQQPDPENVLVMTVVSHDTDGFDGEMLLQLVLACGMRFGEMDIFHRFEDGIDTGAVQFSMANATGNGIFDVNAMADLHTRAVSFFMSMEEPREVMNAFECMLATAETVARHLNGELVDDNRLLMRPQTQEHYRQRVRDFEMRNLRRRSG